MSPLLILAKSHVRPYNPYTSARFTGRSTNQPVDNPINVWTKLGIPIRCRQMDFAQGGGALPGASMFLCCCHLRLPVSIYDDLCDDHGAAAFALFEPAGPRILIDRNTPPERRRRELVHELGHAFDHIAGKVDAADQEAPQIRVAAIESAFAASLDQQGGEQCIHALFGDEGIMPIDDETFGEPTTVLDESAAEWPTRIACPICQHQHSSGRVRNGTPAFNPRLNTFVRWRVMNCPNCEREFRWLQRCNWEGLPLPDVVVAPTARRLNTVE